MADLDTDLGAASSSEVYAQSLLFGNWPFPTIPEHRALRDDSRRVTVAKSGLCIGDLLYAVRADVTMASQHTFRAEASPLSEYISIERSQSSEVC